ncbi:unnamed protein product [Ectocarpus sp. 6 AP-2014]
MTGCGVCVIYLLFISCSVFLLSLSLVTYWHFCRWGGIRRFCPCSFFVYIFVPLSLGAYLHFSRWGGLDLYSSTGPEMRNVKIGSRLNPLSWVEGLAEVVHFLKKKEFLVPLDCRILAPVAPVV